MTASLNDSLQIILPDLDRTLVTADALDPIVMLARLLPPIHCAGFECRLGGNNSQVDFQQRVLADPSEPEQLRKHLFRSGWLTVSPWARIDTLCSHLNNPSSILYDKVPEFWMEFDIPLSSTNIPIPSVFLSLKRPFPEKIFLKIAANILALLQDKPAPAPLLSSLQYISSICPEGAGIIDIGMLLARKTEIIRANVGKIAPDQIKSFLEKIRWCGDMDALVNTYRRLSALADRISLCLDVGAEIYPRIGLECFIGFQTDKKPQWAELIDELTGSGLCAPAKRKALLAWPGYTYPTSRPEPWPVGLMVESMLGPPDQFSVMGRRLSHLKLDFIPKQPVTAKGYFGFGRLWLQTAVSEAEEINRPVTRSLPGALEEKAKSAPAGHPDYGQITASIRKGIHFLMGARNQDGWWHDFYDFKKGSDEWVTAYTGSALASLKDDSAREAAKQAWNLLALRRQSHEGWGYNASLPADADSTAWGLRLAKELGQENSQRARAAVRFLKQHWHPNGGVFTHAEKYFREFTGLSGGSSLQGWCQPHPEVTAAAAAVEGFGKSARRFLRNTQHPEGYWKAYWDCGSEYATALAAEALTKGSRRKNDRQVERAVQWAATRFVDSGTVLSEYLSGPSAYASACCLRIIALAKNKRDIHKLLALAIAALIKEQQYNGSWLPSVRMRVPPSFVLDPERQTDGTVTVMDNKGIFTTATVLRAFEIAKNFFV